MQHSPDLMHTSSFESQKGINAVPLRTRRALSQYKVYGNSTLLVLNETSLSSNNTLLVLNGTSLSSFNTLLTLN